MKDIKPKLFLCSGIKISETDGRKINRDVIELDSLGDNPNVNVRLENISTLFNQNLSDRLIDLLEIAAYVFTADSSSIRGTGFTDNGTNEKWGRDFHFVIPVRDLDFWKSERVIKLLTTIIDFTSNDKAIFDFIKLEQKRKQKEYFEFGGIEDWNLYGVDRVTMFSGGLDSLAGIVEESNSNQKLMLVSHSPVASTQSRQTRLYNKLKEKFGNETQHIPVIINKNPKFGKEFLQRTRSFLFSAIGTIVAETIKAKGVRFYENGIVSLNLPVANEVLRARASRTTHPQSLKLYSELYSLVTERDFIVDNPYLFKTKADIVEIILKNNGGDLIQHSCSCAHTGFFQSSSQWHCGTCSQCIDRRIAIFAANAQQFDINSDYKEDVFIGKRKDGYEKNMAVNFIRHAFELEGMSEFEIASKFSMELTRAVRFFPNRSEATQSLINIHKKHGKSVNEVITKQLKENAEEIYKGKLDASCMLSAIANQKHLESSWKDFAEKIFELLNNGIPISCATNKPNNEPHLQEICDGILNAHENLLLREFPFMRWSSGSTKPDWSSEEHRLFVELKYVRERKDLGSIREAIASDITKYGDNNQRVLFIVYDPKHLIINEADFAEPVNLRETMIIRFLR